MKSTICLSVLLNVTLLSFGQTKVFKEVNEEISTQINMIRQDGSLVGYVAFTQLEKASEDSFNYRISIMDENLNDIGIVNFRQEELRLQAVSFDQDVLCLGYIKIGKQPRLKGRKARINVKSIDNAVVLQFLGLDGKIIEMVKNRVGLVVDPLTGSQDLAHSIQLRNVPNAGFACFYGEEEKNQLGIYDYRGKQLWQKSTTEKANAYGLLASADGVYILSKKNNGKNEGGYEVSSYSNKDGAVLNKYIAKDKIENSLKVLQFDLDPATGKPFISGNIINKRKGGVLANAASLKKGVYDGVFTVNFNGPKKSDIKEVFTYWNNGSQQIVSSKGRYRHNNSFASYHSSFRDAEGNTYFAGSAVIKKPKWGSIFWSVVTAPLVIPPIVIVGAGLNKYKMMDAIVVSQDGKGTLKVNDDIKADHSKFYSGRFPLRMPVNRGINNVYNSNNKTNYLIIYDTKEITIYNVNIKKTLRVIPRKDGSVSTYVFPAKEGHIMVSEYNKKEKTSRYSIESL
ncbi:MAG: hypothetical protein ABWZ25_11845 [Chitinophagaceae bacterium]